MLDKSRFNEEFEWFRRLIPRWDEGRPFISFDEGVAERWEGYKPRVRRRARDILASSAWTEAEIGFGTILQRTIEAVEVEENNLLTWQNRRRRSKDHRVLLDARQDTNLRLELERRLFDLFKGVADEGATFGLLKDALGAKYPLLAYLFFLKDMRRFMPIRPTFFDSAFRDLGIDLVSVCQKTINAYSPGGYRDFRWRSRAEYCMLARRFSVFDAFPRRSSRHRHERNSPTAVPARSDSDRQDLDQPEISG